jgi:UDP-N-acetyl-D-mannosaminuronic acid transferase (WecB/TagA/CpsF family)
VLIRNGRESFIAYGRKAGKSNSKLIRIGAKIENYIHSVCTLVSYKHGFASKHGASKLINQIEKIKPDIIGLHNIRGYYINLYVLFLILW